jgi:hydrogenase-4 component F
MLKFGSAKIENIKGAIKLLRATSVALLIGFLGITGVPPFGIFITEFNILSAGIGNFWYIIVLALIAFVLVFIGFFNRIVGAVFGQARETLVKGENNLFTVLPILVLIIMLAVGSFYLPQSIWSLIHSAAAVIN